MPVDASVFNNLRSFSDYERAEEEFQLKRLMAAAELKKAQQLDLDAIGEQAFAKAMQGLPLNELDKAGLNWVDSKQQTVTYNPVTGGMEQRPSLLKRAGINVGQQQPNAEAARTLPPSAFTQTMGNWPKDAMPPGVAPADFGQPPPQQTPQGYVVPNATGATIFNPDDAGDFAPNPIVLQKPDGTRSDTPLPQAVHGMSPSANPKLQQKILENQAAAISPQAIFEKENKLRDEFNTLTKNFRTVQDSWNRVQRLSDTPAGDIALLFATAKLNDPESVVRESEFAIQAAAGSFGDRMQNLVGQVTTGNRLTPSQRESLKAEAARIYESQKGGYGRIVENYRGLAGRGGLDERNIITDYAQPNAEAMPTADKSRGPAPSRIDAINELRRRELQRKQGAK